MGSYINISQPFDKIKFIEEHYNGLIIPKPPDFSKIPKRFALIVVISSTRFEVAGFAFDEDEFKEFTRPEDSRHKAFILMDRKQAEMLSGFKRRKKVTSQ